MPNAIGVCESKPVCLFEARMFTNILRQFSGRSIEEERLIEISGKPKTEWSNRSDEASYFGLWTPRRRKVVTKLHISRKIRWTNEWTNELPIRSWCNRYQTWSQLKLRFIDLTAGIGLMSARQFEETRECESAGPKASKFDCDLSGWESVPDWFARLFAV